MPIYALNDQPIFPPPSEAEPDGLLALGGDLKPARVLAAYAQGVFPWPVPGAPLAWFSPDPRMLLAWDHLRVTRSLRRSLRRFDVTMDTAFEEVVTACAGSPRDGQSGTWITGEMRGAYEELHALGFAHSVEVWEAGELVGGLYGVSLGGMFCGESMFSRRSDASKVAFVNLARQLEAWDFDFLDCQLHTSHLERLGAMEVERADFLERLDRTMDKRTRRGRWRLGLRAVR